MNIDLNAQEIEDNKLAILIAIKQLDLNPNNSADRQLADRLEEFTRRLDELNN